jgi:hypothetical protein
MIRLATNIDPLLLPFCLLPPAWDPGYGFSIGAPTMLPHSVQEPS